MRYYKTWINFLFYDYCTAEIPVNQLFLYAKKKKRILKFGNHAWIKAAKSCNVDDVYLEKNFSPELILQLTQQ